MDEIFDLLDLADLTDLADVFEAADLDLDSLSELLDGQMFDGMVFGMDGSAFIDGSEAVDNAMELGDPSIIDPADVDSWGSGSEVHEFVSSGGNAEGAATLSSGMNDMGYESPSDSALLFAETPGDIPHLAGFEFSSFGDEDAAREIIASSIPDGMADNISEIVYDPYPRMSSDGHSGLLGTYDAASGKVCLYNADAISNIGTLHHELAHSLVAADEHVLSEYQQCVELDGPYLAPSLDESAYSSDQLLEEHFCEETKDYLRNPGLYHQRRPHVAEMISNLLKKGSGA